MKNTFKIGRNNLQRLQLCGIIFIQVIFLTAKLNAQSTDKYLHYLESNCKPPAEYVVSKFDQYDYVFLGEFHKIKHDVEFVGDLIPLLYEKGVRNLAYEFYDHSNQHFIDSMLTAKTWDEELFYKKVSVGVALLWAYTEYLNIFEKAWKFNQSLPQGSKPFRIVAIGFEYDPCKNGYDQFGGIDPDLQMAENFKKEVIGNNEKALIYCGISHAYTAYKQPYYDFNEKKLIELFNGRFGNIIYKENPGKTFTVCFHSPWPSDKGIEELFVKPVNGVIDRVMSLYNNRPCGFDTKNTPMGELTSDDSYYVLGYQNFTLQQYCDGYIFLAPFSEYESIGFETKYYTRENIERLRKFIQCRDIHNSLLNDEELIKKVEEESKIDKYIEPLR